METSHAVRYVRAALEPAADAAPAAHSHVNLPELDVVQTVEESGEAGRSQLPVALEWIATGKASVLLVPSLRTVAGSLRELVGLLDWIDEAGAILLTEDAALDTSSSAGQAAVALLREVASWDEAPHPDRPRRGRPSLSRMSPELVDRIVALRDSGMSLQAVADQLNAEGTPTPRGGTTWRPSSVQSALGYRRPRPPMPGMPPLPPGPEGRPGPPGREGRPGPPREGGHRPAPPDRPPRPHHPPRPTRHRP